MRYFLLDTYLCSVKRHLSLHFDSNTSFEDTEETNLRFTLSFLQNLFTEVIEEVVARNSLYSSGVYVFADF